ncbi:response regulator [filamentous cyanobacterium LEGE 11480]|uniref:Response regulator n=1 Tax=Romeriopsis navalis LEGE 11480 TaxID=2777977 RepID=A0A928Z2R7_9CYAN|nr:response regulator [Romeriopsis navalis]MBE9029824.1 response regulator [Romeriopsis navalis LEGE 11480]
MTSSSQTATVNNQNQKLNELDNVSSNIPRSSQKVLIVDDDPNLRMLLAAALADDGYETIMAQDGVEGLAQCKAVKPDIILLDAVMPQLDGISCCREIQAHYQSNVASQPCPPILMITAMSDTSVIEQAFAAGASDFITKPIHWPILKQRLQRCLENNVLKHQVIAATNEIQHLNIQLAKVTAS